MSRPTLLLATRNPGKAREFSVLLSPMPLLLRDLRSFPDVPHVAEDGETYLENARAKALAAALSSGLPALADDSGLEVDALGGSPGVRSARFAGPDHSDAKNIALLLERLRGVPELRRTARFRCVVVVARPDGRMIDAEGTCEGRIANAPRGFGGFGYDSVFWHPASGATFAEVPPDLKSRISHRAAACRALLGQLSDFLA